MNNLDTLAWDKMDGLIPAIVQDAKTGTMLMLAYMNKSALQTSLASQKLTLYSRSKQRLWVKGETSGNYMSIQSISTDCDGDSLLVQVIPKGPACHLGFESCFSESQSLPFAFMQQLIMIIEERRLYKDEHSYVHQLMDKGLERCAQKVGEEAVEVVIAALGSKRDAFIAETADLFFHLLILLNYQGVSFQEIITLLENRHKALSHGND